MWRHNLGLVMIAAGPRQGALDLMEHVTITNVGITPACHGRTMPANEVDSVGLLTAYLVRADGQGRVAKMAS